MTRNILKRDGLSELNNICDAGAMTAVLRSRFWVMIRINQQSVKGKKGRLARQNDKLMP